MRNLPIDVFLLCSFLVSLVSFPPTEGPVESLLYYLGMIMAGVGATVLIGALLYVTLMLTCVILSMIAFTAAPILDRVFKN